MLGFQPCHQYNTVHVKRAKYLFLTKKDFGLFFKDETEVLNEERKNLKMHKVKNSVPTQLYQLE